MTSEQPESAVEVLKPCPFCGGEPWKNIAGVVRCSGKHEGHHPTVAMPVAAWNDRATQPAEAQGVGEFDKESLLYDCDHCEGAQQYVSGCDTRHLYKLAAHNRRAEIQYWRNDAFEAAAQIVERYNTAFSDPECGAAPSDIRSLKQNTDFNPAPPQALAAAPQAPAGGDAERMRGALLRIIAEDTPAGTGGGTGGGLKMAAIAREVLAAAPTPQRADAEDVERVDPELVERVRHAVEHPDAKGFQLAKAGMTRHDFRRILAALAAMPRASDDGLAAMERLKRDQFCSGPDCTAYDHGRDEGIALAIAAYTAAMPRASQQAGRTEREDDQARIDAWDEFAGEHLTDGKGYAAADVWRRCETAFNAAWPKGWEAANSAAFAALQPAREGRDYG
jgi:hypothetical protein